MNGQNKAVGAKIGLGKRDVADDVLLGAEPVRFWSAKEKMNHRLYQPSARAIGTEIFFFRPSSEPASSCKLKWTFVFAGFA
jgi:hypothetical protein